TEVQGTRFGIIAFVAASLALALPAQSRLHEMLANATRPSPDDSWKVKWRCDERSERGPCIITLSPGSDGQVVFPHSPLPRYITCNNISEVVRVETSTPNQPRITVLS